MSGPAHAIETYIQAKDGNRPWLMRRAFAPAATLQMALRTDAVSFPPSAAGAEAITEILVRGFCRSYENIYTFCLATPNEVRAPAFSCDWLVAMTSRDSHEIRVGCGRYGWFFQAREPHLVERLTIDIERMRILPPQHLETIMGWLSVQPHPWCPANALMKAMPALPELAEIAAYFAPDR